MTLVRTEDFLARRVTFTLTISSEDYARVKLGEFDRAVIADCEKADATLADKLLALELIVRRIEEGQASRAA